MKIMAPLILLFALVLAMSSAVDLCTDGGECCDDACTDCFVCSCGGAVSVVLEASASDFHDLPVVGELALPSPKPAFSGYTLLPDIPPRSLS